MSAGRSPAPTPRGPDASKWPTAARSCSTKSPKSTLPLQAKLLRVLQERSFERVGSSQTQRGRRPRAGHDQPRPARPRWTRAASARTSISAWPCCRLHVPAAARPPRGHPRTDRTLSSSAAPSGCNASLARWTLRPKTCCSEYHWPGNVRELENIITRASVLNAGRPVAADELRRWLIVPGRRFAGGRKAWRRGRSVGLSLEEMERRLIEATLEHFAGHRAKTAKALGIGLRTLSGKAEAIWIRPREISFGLRKGGRIVVRRVED